MMGRENGNSCWRRDSVLLLAGIRISEFEGWVSWLNEPLQQIAGADVQAGEIVYYKFGVTNAQMESFQQAVLDQPRPDGKGSDLMPGITYFLEARAVAGAWARRVCDWDQPEPA